MNQKVTSLTLQVNDLQHAKASLESKVSSLEAEMDCVMGRRESCSPSTCMNGGSLISVSNRQTDRQTGRQTDKHADKQTHRPTHRQTGPEKDRQTDRKKKTDRQTPRQTPRQTDRKKA